MLLGFDIQKKKKKNQTMTAVTATAATINFQQFKREWEWKRNIEKDEKEEVNLQIFNVRQVSSKVFETIWPLDFCVIVLPFNFAKGTRVTEIEKYFRALRRYVDESHVVAQY